MREHMGLDKLHCPVKTCPYYTKAFSTETGLNHHLKTHVEDKRKYMIKYTFYNWLPQIVDDDDNE